MGTGRNHYRYWFNHTPDMDITGTQAVLEALPRLRNIYKLLCVDRNTVASWRLRMKTAQYPTLDKIGRSAREKSCYRDVGKGLVNK